MLYCGKTTVHSSIAVQAGEPHGNHDFVWFQARVRASVGLCSCLGSRLTALSAAPCRRYGSDIPVPSGCGRRVSGVSRLADLEHRARRGTQAAGSPPGSLLCVRRAGVRHGPRGRDQWPLEPPIVLRGWALRDPRCRGNCLVQAPACPHCGAAPSSRARSPTATGPPIQPEAAELLR